MQSNDIFTLLNGKKCHTQLIQREFELLKLMVDQNLLKEKHIELLY